MRRRLAARVLRVMGVAAVASGLLVLVPGGSPAGADTAAVNGSWFWLDQPPSVPGEGPVPAVGQPAGNIVPPDVPSGDIAVTVRNDTSDKETYLHVDTSAIAPGSTVANFVLTLHEDTTHPSAGAQAAQINALPVSDFFADGGEARPYDERPHLAKGPVIAGKRSDQGVWTFDITSVVSSWLSGDLPNNGVGLVPPSGSFEVVWVGPGSSDTADKPTATGDVTPLGPSSESLGSAGSTSTQASTGAAAPVSPTSSTGSFVSVGTPVIGTATSASVPTPAASTPPAVRLPVRRAVARTHGAPPVGFFLVGAGIITLVAAGLVALGELGEPLPARQGSVLRTLERRAIASSRPSTTQGGA